MEIDNFLDKMLVLMFIIGILGVIVFSVYYLNSGYPLFGLLCVPMVTFKSKGRIDIEKEEKDENL